MIARLQERVEWKLAGPLGIIVPLLVLIPLIFGYSALNRVSEIVGGSTLQKVMVLVAMTIAALLLGTRMPPWPVWVIGGTVGVAYVVGLITQARGIDGFDTEMLFGAAGLVYPWLAFFIDWRKIDQTWRAAALTAIAPIAVAFASMTHVTGLLGIEVVRVEYTGATRLSAGMPPAYLAGLALIGVCGAMWLWVQRRWVGFYLALINLAICALTTTRVATLAAGLIFVAMVIVAIVHKYPQWIAASTISIVGGVIGSVVLLPNFLDRMQNTAGGLIGGTGRSRAWRFFLGELESYPWTGYGPGSSPLLAGRSNDETIRRAFVSPHNNYIDFMVDLGIPLAIVFVAGIVAILIHVVRRASGDLRWLVGVTAIACLVYATFDNLLTAPQSALMFVTFIAMISADGSDRRTSAHAASTDDAAAEPQVVSPRREWRVRQRNVPQSEDAPAEARGER